MNAMLLRVLFITCIAALTAVSQQMPPIEPGVSHELAKWRAAYYSDVRYKLNLTLEKMSPVLKGTMEIRVKVSPIPFSLTTPSGETLTGKRAELQVPEGTPMPPIILDWRKIKGNEGRSTISNVSLNDVSVSPRCGDAGGGACVPAEERDEHLIFRDGVKMGENVIKLDFTSPILTSGSAITRYVDKEDGAEYIYSLFVPSDASTAFPVFDQPDLKARFTLKIAVPTSWNVISNSGYPGYDATGYKKWISQDVVGPINATGEWTTTTQFDETKPISSYVFAFAAGPWAQVSEPGAVATGSATPSNANDTKNRVATASRSDNRADPLSSIYVRKSQAAKFKPHAAEIFRLNREGIKYLETYFDYKFPFPKYDLVLIPEFPFGGMEHAGATFLREASIIFPTEPTKSDHISRANLIFHEAAHQWFGDTVTMKWFDDLWLKEGFAEFMGYKTLEKVMPDANAWKVFYERNKQAAYATDSTRGTTPIYQPIKNLSSAKSAYGNIVYRKAPSFLRQAEFYLGEQKFQTAVRAFLKKHEYANAGWEDLVKEFGDANYGNEIKNFYNKAELQDWANQWIKQRGTAIVRVDLQATVSGDKADYIEVNQKDALNGNSKWEMKFQVLTQSFDDRKTVHQFAFSNKPRNAENSTVIFTGIDKNRTSYVFPNYQDYGYGIFLLDDKSRDYVLKNIGREKDDFLRTMMWGSLWDSVREAELDPKVYVELAIKSLPTEQDETTVSSILGRVGTAMNYYLPDAQRNAIAPRLEAVLLDRLQHAPTAGQRITFYRAFVSMASTDKGREVLKEMLAQGSSGGQRPADALQASRLRSDGIPLRTKDKFDIVTRLIILGDPDALKLLETLEKSETSDDAKRYAYAAKAGFATPENKAKFWSDFTANKDISESWIEAAFGPFNNIHHADLTLPYLERALAELPNHKRTRKIFFVNGWLGAFIGGQRSKVALDIVNKFLDQNPNLDRDLRLKILENVDLIERAVKIRSKYGKN